MVEITELIKDAEWGKYRDAMYNATSNILKNYTLLYTNKLDSIFPYFSVIDSTKKKPQATVTINSETFGEGLIGGKIDGKKITVYDKEFYPIALKLAEEYEKITLKRFLFFKTGQWTIEKNYI